MEIDKKLEILKSMDTKNLMAKMRQYEDELEQALTEMASFKSQNHQFLGSGDCQKVKEMLAILAVQIPETNEAGKRMTVAEKDAWLQRQRAENAELAAAIQQQQQVGFLLDDFEIKCEMARRRLAGATVVVALRTQQIAFLAS